MISRALRGDLEAGTAGLVGFGLESSAGREEVGEAVDFMDLEWAWRALRGDLEAGLVGFGLEIPAGRDEVGEVVGLMDLERVWRGDMLNWAGRKALSGTSNLLGGWGMQASCQIEGEIGRECAEKKASDSEVDE